MKIFFLLLSLFAVAASPPLPYPIGYTHGPAPAGPKMSALAVGVKLEWNAPLVPPTFYHLYHGTAPNDYTNRVQILGSETNYVVAGLDSSIRNYFAMTAINVGMDGKGPVSQFGNEAVYFPEPPSPTLLKYVFLEWSADPTGPWVDILTNAVSILTTNENSGFYRQRIQK